MLFVKIDKIHRACDDSTSKLRREMTEQNLNDLFTTLFWYYPLLSPLSTSLDDTIADKIEEITPHHPALASKLRLRLLLLRINN